jgi:hypothetical protein
MSAKNQWTKQEQPNQFFPAFFFMAKNGDKQDSRESQEGIYNFLHENRFEKYSSFFSETLIFFKFSENFPRPRRRLHDPAARIERPQFQ